ncbi:MAG TPA: hypothetical protein VMU14_12125 [Acidimicrobiales bacterium]|nr:hypothetical protein [Acidimicrobiales bacterium]
MGQPEFVPVPDWDRVVVTEGMPPTPPWVPDRPAEVRPAGVQPTGRMFGAVGPDQGYALRLAEGMHDQLRLAPGEDRHDVVSGAVGVAMKRSALFGRAPVRADLDVGFGVWGFLDDAPEELVALRRAMFAQASHDYGERRAIADAVPEETLRLSPADVRSRLSDWRSLLRLDG